MSVVATILNCHPPASPAQPTAASDPCSEAVIAAAILVATAFRLRDEDALVTALRQLVRAVQLMEETSR